MNRNVLLGVGAVALAVAAFVSLSGDEGETAPEHGVARAATAPEHAEPSSSVDRAPPPRRLVERRDRTPSAAVPPEGSKQEQEDLEQVDAAVVVAKEELDFALSKLEGLDPAEDPAGVGRAVREVQLAFQRLENETDPENEIHRRIHDRAVEQLEARLRVISGPPGPKTGHPEPAG